jgi:hypothetical protein
MARRFRIVFWVVVVLGALPEAVSGVMLTRWFRVEALCAPMRPFVDVATFQELLRWQRVHDWGRFGAMLAGLLVLGYAGAWAYEAGLSIARRRLVMALLLGVLLPFLALALWTGRAVPWPSLAPGISLATGDVRTLPTRSSEEAGGPSWCIDHAREVGHLRLAWWSHVGAGGLALVVLLGLADLGARWRRTHPSPMGRRS